ncbi:hypothetical protein BD779DRAFT_1792199 [Infundibulicybe gibba]|nr:hypothetical protein BD779DRAFT_1792199 [Infundibulicybe gibba]
MAVKEGAGEPFGAELFGGQPERKMAGCKGKTGGGGRQCGGQGFSVASFSLAEKARWFSTAFNEVLVLQGLWAGGQAADTAEAPADSAMAWFECGSSARKEKRGCGFASPNTRVIRNRSKATTNSPHFGGQTLPEPELGGKQKAVAGGFYTEAACLDHKRRGTRTIATDARVALGGERLEARLKSEVQYRPSVKLSKMIIIATIAAFKILRLDSCQPYRQLSFSSLSVHGLHLPTSPPGRGRLAWTGLDLCVPMQLISFGCQRAAHLVLSVAVLFLNARPS